MSFVPTNRLANDLIFLLSLSRIRRRKLKPQDTSADFYTSTDCSDVAFLLLREAISKKAKRKITKLLFCRRLSNEDT